MDSQETTTTAVTADLDNVALTIYDSLIKEGFSTEDKISIVKSVSSLIRSDIDENIKQLQRLKTTF